MHEIIEIKALEASKNTFKILYNLDFFQLNNN